MPSSPHVVSRPDVIDSDEYVRSVWDPADLGSVRRLFFALRSRPEVGAAI